MVLVGWIVSLEREETSTIENPEHGNLAIVVDPAGIEGVDHFIRNGFSIFKLGNTAD